MPREFQHAICNEIYGAIPFAEVCRDIRRIGYNGIEIAPFTLDRNPTAIAPARRREYRDIIASEGLRFAGLHWLLAAPASLHATTSDRATRERTWAHVAALIDLCADLGDRGVMVFGSPQQRCAAGGLEPADATRNFIDGLAGVALRAQERGVRILVEALPANQCDVVNTLAEAVAIVREIGGPGVRTMFDTHNAVDETEPHDILIERYFDLIEHVHINEMDGGRPGAGGYDFKPMLAALARCNYSGWLSLEAFDFTPGPEAVAEESLRFIESEIHKLAI
jgi:D-psicose/D-tagatose/L-ribulose 3-epimerase